MQQTLATVNQLRSAKATPSTGKTRFFYRHARQW